MVYEARRALDLDHALAARGLKRRFAVMVPGFGAVASFLRASPRLPMYMIWHARTHHDPAHRWMRQQLEAVVPAAA